LLHAKLLAFEFSILKIITL